jgi:hypothetical protein
MTEYLIRLIASEELHQTMGCEGHRRLIKYFDRKEINGTWLELLETLYWNKNIV